MGLLQTYGIDKKAEGKEEMIVAMIGKGYALDEIASIADVPVEAIAAVQQKDQLQ